MKREHGLLLLVLVMLAGCAGAPPETPVVLDPVGHRVAGPSRGRQGFLRVYTATTDEASGEIGYQVHTPYWVYNEQGRKVKSVQNHVGVTDQRPMTALLPPGTYRVYARADGFGLVTVPVVISAGMLTEVHLQYRGMEVPAGVPDEDVVRLPGGRVAGYRAKGAPPAKRAGSLHQ